MDILIYEAITENDIAEIKKLFIEYAESLNFDLCFQGFDKELNSLPGKYSPPEGFLLLAELNNKIAGCIALRKLERDICEMKRLYVRPEFRGHNIGKLLCDELIKKAKSKGYKKMRLDTISHQMRSAIKLYKSYGFYEIPAYYHNPQEGVIFMELEL
ncbi:MAG TPA: GNAT family N-acetyltransferase [Ignavibacteria bacterium]